YGAIGDGVADDTVAIQQAIDDIKQNNGGKLFFPKGAYLFTEVALCSNITIEQSPNTKILIKGKEFRGFRAENQTNITIRGLIVERTNYRHSAFYFYQCDNITFEGNAIKGIDPFGE